MLQLERVVEQLLERLDVDTDHANQRQVLEDAIAKLEAMNSPVPEAMTNLHAELESKVARSEVPISQIQELLMKLLSRTKQSVPSFTKLDGISTERLQELIVWTLQELGGSAPVRDVLLSIQDRHASEFSPEDLESLSGGRLRWQNRAKRARERLVQEGVLEDKIRGVWTLAQN